MWEWVKMLPRRTHVIQKGGRGDEQEIRNKGMGNTTHSWIIKGMMKKIIIGFCGVFQRRGRQLIAELKV